MTHRFADVTFTDSVKAAQEQYGSRAHNQRLQTIAGPNDRFGARETDFIARRDTFYLATVTDTGWPYVQHRGGPAGVLKVLGETQLADDRRALVPRTRSEVTFSLYFPRPVRHPLFIQ